MALTTGKHKKIRRELTKRWSDDGRECALSKLALLAAVEEFDTALDANDPTIAGWHSAAARNKLTDRQRESIMLSVLRERRDGK